MFGDVSPGNGNGNQTFPGGFKDIDACVYASNGCSGGDIKDGLQAGASDSFLLTLTRADSTDPWTVDSFALKFQTSAGSAGGRRKKKAQNNSGHGK